MASIRPVKGGGWRVYVARLGVRDTATFTKEEGRPAAKAWATQREAAILADAAKAKVKTGHTVAAVIDQFKAKVLPGRKSEGWEAGRIEFLAESLTFTGVLIRKLTKEDIQEWVDERAHLVAGSTINRDLNLLSAIFSAAVEWEWVADNPLHGFKRPANPEPRNRRLAQGEIDAVVAAFGYEVGTVAVSRHERIALAFLLALEIGLRKGELLKTRWTSVHADYIHLPAAITKNGSKRDVPFTPRARELVALMPRLDERLMGGISSDEFDRLWRGGRDKAGVVDLHFHDTRHEAVTRLAKVLDVLGLAKMIGHKDLKSLMIYYNPTPEEIAAKLAAALTPPAAPVPAELPPPALPA